MKKALITAAALIGVLLLAGCGYQTASTPAPAGQNQTQAPAPSGNAADSVAIQNFAFNPGTLTVSKGATVTWMNRDAAPHQIKSATFNSSLLNQGQSFSFTFNETGTFDYSCAIHPSMLGKIVVQ